MKQLEFSLRLHLNTVSNALEDILRLEQQLSPEQTVHSVLLVDSFDTLAQQVAAAGFKYDVLPEQIIKTVANWMRGDAPIAFMLSA